MKDTIPVTRETLQEAFDALRGSGDPNQRNHAAKKLQKLLTASAVEPKIQGNFKFARLQGSDDGDHWVDFGSQPHEQKPMPLVPWSKEQEMLESWAQPQVQEPVMGTAVMTMDYDNPKQSGRNAFAKGVKRHECPVSPRTEQNALCHWLSGWDEAEQEHLKGINNESD